LVQRRKHQKEANCGERRKWKAIETWLNDEVLQWGEKIIEERKKKKKKPKVNLILLHVNHTFLILDSQIRTQAFKHTHCTLRKKKRIMWKRVQFRVQFVLNWSLGFKFLDFYLKWPLRRTIPNARWNCGKKKGKRKFIFFLNSRWIEFSCIFCVLSMSTCLFKLYDT
jgi:hypothetical protein